jgi:hypothetical protein
MVGVTGEARSNSLPPTLALALLAAVQIGLLFAVAEPLRRRLAARPAGTCRSRSRARGR